jgi:N-acetylglutamate synthase-like GNAT family acetyltransferase
MKKYTLFLPCLVVLCTIIAVQAMELQELPSDDIVVYKATEKDIPALISMSNEVLNEFFKPTLVTAYPEYTQDACDELFKQFDIFFEKFLKDATEVDNNNHCILIASHKTQQERLGLCAFTKEEDSILIEYLIVPQQLRGKGIGRELLKNVFLTYTDIAKCCLYTLAKGNQKTHTFYEKLGFTSTKEPITIVEAVPYSHIMYALEIKK